MTRAQLHNLLDAWNAAEIRATAARDEADALRLQINKSLAPHFPLNEIEVGPALIAKAQEGDRT